MNSERGNALLMALALSAFVAVISMEMYRRAGLTAARSQQAQFKDETRLIMDAFASHVQNPETCTRMLYNQQIAPGTANGTPVTLNYIYDPLAVPGSTTLTTESVVTTGIKLLGVEVFAPGIADRYDEVMDLGGTVRFYRRFRGSLRAAFASTGSPVANRLAPANYRSDSVLGTDFGIPFYVWVDENSQIKTCFGINSAGAVCNLARGYYHVEPPGTPQFNHQLSCRQTGFMTEESDAAAVPASPLNDKGTCRFVGFASPGGCPADPFVPGIPYEFRIHDGRGSGFTFTFPRGFTPTGAQPSVICTQCQ